MRRPGRPRITIIVLVLASITILTLDFRGAGIVGGIRDGVGDVLGPVGDGAQRLFRPVTNVWNGAFGYDDLERENEALRRRLEGAQAEVAAARGTNDEIAELRALLKLGAPAASLPRACADVVDGNPSNFDATIELTKGSAQGIAVGDPVVSAFDDGGATSAPVLVGRVVGVSRNRAEVRLVTDPVVQIGVAIPEAGNRGLAQGTGAGQPLDVRLLESDDPGMAPGLVVKTHGDASRYPPDLVVGTVSAVARVPGAPELRVRVQPAVDLGRLSVVCALQYPPRDVTPG